MGVFTLGEAACGAVRALAPEGRGAARRTPHRTGAPVLRGSIEAGTFEESFFAVPGKGETDHLLRVARRTLDAGRRLKRDARAGARTLSAAERAIAALTAAAVRVYDELLTLARLNKGRVFPSYDHLAEATGLGRATVARALPLLERIGFLVRQRRFKRVEAHGAGPRYVQTSNAYRAILPAKVLAYLPRWMRPAPLPVDMLQHGIERSMEHEAMLATLGCKDLAQVTVSGPAGCWRSSVLRLIVVSASLKIIRNPKQIHMIEKCEVA